MRYPFINTILKLKVLLSVFSNDSYTFYFSSYFTTGMLYFSA